MIAIAFDMKLPHNEHIIAIQNGSNYQLYLVCPPPQLQLQHPPPAVPAAAASPPHQHYDPQHHTITHTTGCQINCYMNVTRSSTTILILLLKADDTIITQPLLAGALLSLLDVACAAGCSYSFCWSTFQEDIHQHQLEQVTTLRVASIPFTVNRNILRILLHINYYSSRGSTAQH